MSDLKASNRRLALYQAVLGSLEFSNKFTREQNEAIAEAVAAGIEAYNKQLPERLPELKEKGKDAR